ncbi:MAG: RNA polymerase sigma factor [Roseovarius sp.]|uniref:RNA polymerase sigma factor n=1 Tax=Alterinioella nitratireducens TaxID=2735915 RepID=UPI001552E552|nr:RNA polymerase sigma factor [Alterinioella nitratireducens]NPD17995.1 RNA polymerase sigma factor [Alterinioella nitratireducens]
MEPLDAQLDELQDDALMLLFAQGEAGAARILTARLLPRVLNHAARVLGNRTDAEDVAQEAMLRLWRAAGDWQAGGAKVSTWLYRVTANLAIDRLRRTGRAVGLDDTDEPADEDALAADDRLIRADRMAALDAALARLPERQRQAVVLRHIEGVSNPEIAEVLEISVEAVESLTARGKRALAAALAGQKEALGYG